MHSLDVPAIEEILEAGKSLLDGSAVEWKPGAKYVNGTVQTYSARVTSPHGDATWYARSSTHSPDEGSFDQFWNGLGVDHSKNESQYVFLFSDVIW